MALPWVSVTFTFYIYINQVACQAPSIHPLWSIDPLMIQWEIRLNWIEIELKLNWNWIEIELKLNWNWIEIELKLNWNWIEIELKLNWNWIEIELKLNWNWIEIELKLNWNWIEIELKQTFIGFTTWNGNYYVPRPFTILSPLCLKLVYKNSSLKRL